MVVCALRLPPAVSGSGVRFGRAYRGLGFGCAPPRLGGMLGCVCARAPVPRGLLHLLVGVAVRQCVFLCAPRLFPAFPGWGAVCGRACWARVSAVPRPSWLGCRGVFFALFVFGRVLVWLCGVGCCLSLSRALWSLSPHPLSFGLGCWLFFFFQRGVCLHVSVSLFPVGRCSGLGVAGFGWVVPLCLFWGPVFGAFWVGGSAASCGVGGRFGGCGLFSCPPASPLCFRFLGGACLFLPLPSLGWRTHWPAFSVVFRAAVGSCILLGRVPAPWVRWAMYTLGSAPLPAGLGPGSAGRAAAPGGCVWLWVRGLGLSVSLLLCGAGFNLLGNPPPFAGRAVAPSVDCGAAVWRAGAAPSGVCGGLFRLVLQVRFSRAVLCRSVPRRVPSCCGALHCDALWCSVSWSRVVPWWVSGGQPGLCRGAECGRSVACWWLGGAVRCGCFAGSVLWGPACAARASGSGRRPWGCPPWGPVPWSRVLWGSRFLALDAVVVPSSSSGACEVALVAAGVVAWR